MLIGNLSVPEFPKGGLHGAYVRASEDKEQTDKEQTDRRNKPTKEQTDRRNKPTERRTRASSCNNKPTATNRPTNRPREGQVIDDNYFAPLATIRIPHSGLAVTAGLAVTGRCKSPETPFTRRCSGDNKPTTNRPREGQEPQQTDHSEQTDQRTNRPREGQEPVVRGVMAIGGHHRCSLQRRLDRPLVVQPEN